MDVQPAPEKMQVNVTPQPRSLGIIQLRDHETNERILVPKPSDDPNDPLNWSKARRNYVFGLACTAIFLAHCLAVGPSVALVPIAIDFYGADNFSAHIGTVSYLQTVCSLMMGLGNLMWVPLSIKYGRRPTYVASSLLMTACCVWCGAAKTFPSALAARSLLGIAIASPEVIVPLTITDIFFLHQRGRVMVIYTCALSVGVGVGVVVSGLITMHHSWRVIYWIFTALISVCTVLIIFTFPETNFKRQVAPAAGPSPTANLDSEKSLEDDLQDERVEDVETESRPPIPTKKTYLQELKVLSTVYTSERLLPLVFRPVAAIVLPALLWATMINTMTIGMTIVISASFSNAFAEIYGFATWQAGLTFIASIIGSLVGIFWGGHAGDWVADKLTVRNGGVRTPEMRLPAMVISLITGPLSCLLYGFGFGKRLHWMCATVGIGLVNFTIVQANNIGLVYIIDSYRPIAGEVIITQSAFKAVFAFLLSFYVDSWIQQDGYITVFSIFAGVSAAVFLSTAIFYFWGVKLRHVSWKWLWVRKFLHWHADREVGE
ncbi:Major facilitator superfamily domain, general substrate transporter [Pleurostoma richardsiae]|uniref:Major facilitator superfamily domain, general substrate transporter n=1 Tax=Pleurostoma richardsiae TaxID=41990 RepID=A0AA38RBQ9_9PEZI|nr:Major facilitator superfamily domain, general substrate transporter [Pleurostoma richardsiae]